jgi:two-component system cell cycle sensor histidine kinase/response regulator CckA
MPSESSTHVLARLAGAVAQAEPEDALRESLAVARELGALPVTQDRDAPLLLALTHGARTLALALPAAAPLDAEARVLLADLLRFAFTRAAEHEELQRVRERVELLSAASFEGLFFHIDGVIFDANHRLSELLGYERADLLGDETLRRCVDAEDLPAVLRRMASGFQGEYVITAIRKDGSRFRAELQAKQGKLGDRPVRVVAVRDVTERERTQALLRESEERLRSLAETAFDITGFSRDGVILDIAGAIETVLGYTREQMIGRPIMSFVAQSETPHMGKAISNEHAGVFQSLAIGANGEEIPVEIAAVHTTWRGERVRMTAMRDLREVKRGERERRELERMLERSQRLESLGVLAGGIAHDFNNLLTTVLANADLLRIRTLDAGDRALVQDIIVSAQRGANLTAQMLAYAGRAELGPRTFIDLGMLLPELHTLLGATLSKKAGVSLEIADGSVVLGNRATITQVFMNLLTNASDALAGQAGTIRVCTRRVAQPDARWALALGSKVEPGHWVLVEVSDTGVGMDPETQSRIFEPFFSTKAEGHGLGLAATVGIVSSHGGAILVESAVGRGSTFMVLLPAYDGAPPVEPRMRKHVKVTARSVLVVDDEPLVRSSVRAMLEAHGYEVREADSGGTAIEAIARDEPGLVLLDMSMPDLTGSEVLQYIRQSGSQVPVILSSGYHDAALDLEAGSYQRFLVKPYTVAELLDAVGTNVRHQDPSAGDR